MSSSRASASGSPGRLLEPLGHADVLHRRERVEEVVPLEDEADEPADVDQFLLRRAAQFAVVAAVRVPDFDLAFLQRAQPADEREKRRFTGAGRPAHDDEFAGHHFERVVEEDLRARVAGAEVVVHSADAEHRRAGRRRGERSLTPPPPLGERGSWFRPLPLGGGWGGGS